MSYLKVPVRVPNQLFSFLNPLAIEIWLYMVGAYVLVSITIWIVARFSPIEWKEPELCDECLVEKLTVLYGLDSCYNDRSSDDEGSSGIGSELDCRQNRSTNVNDEEEIEFVSDPCLYNEYEEATLEVLENDFNLANSFWFAIGTLMQQGSDLNPKVQYLPLRFKFVILRFLINYNLTDFSLIKFLIKS